MIPDTQNPEIQITKIEIENEVEATKIQKDKSYLTPVKIHEILKQNVEEGYVKTINVENVNQDTTDVQENEIDTPVKNSSSTMNVNKNVKNVVPRFRGANKTALYPAEFWVQFNFAGGDDVSPLSYDPDRNSFVLLVFSIVAIMLCLTALFVGYIYYTEDLRDQFEYEGGVFAIVGCIGIMCVNYCMTCLGCTRVPPCNIIMLIFAVIFMSLLAAYVTVRYRTDIIFLAALATLVVVIVCMCLACTSFDFTHYLLYVIAICAAFFALVLVITITELVTGIRSKPLNIVILIVGTLLNVIVLVLELQMILGGKSVEIGEDDYALGAFMLYTSIVNTFLKIVQLLGLLDDG